MTVFNCAYISDSKTSSLVKAEGLLKPVMSKDGSAVAFLKGSSLYAYDFSDFKTRLLISDCQAFCAYKGEWFFAADKTNGIVMINAKTGVFYICVPKLKGADYNYLSVSPDAKYIAYSLYSYSDNKDSQGLWLHDISTGLSSLVIKDEQSSESSLGTVSRPGKYSPDGNKLFVWLMPRSASMSADGVSTAVYDINKKQLTYLDQIALCYDGNVSFANSDTVAVIRGSGREMFSNKYLTIFNLGDTLSVKDVTMEGMVTTSPCYSKDGSKLVFAASPKGDKNDDYKTQAQSVLKRRIYIYDSTNVTALTSEADSPCESPVFLNNRNIIFAKASGNEKSVWIMDENGQNQRLVVGWTSDDQNKAFDYYGRVDFSSRFSVFDGTKD